MIPVVTPDEMRAVDAAATDPVEVLIDRAGRAVARAAVRLMGGTYGRRVVVVAGPGNNGADGRVGAAALERRGVRVQVLEPNHGGPIGNVDLVVDAAYGTGLSRPYDFPPVGPGIPVLAVDIPSGVDGLTGEQLGRPVRAEATITFAALKPGLLHEPGRTMAGRLELVPIAGLDVSSASIHLVEATDVAGWLPVHDAKDHKWRAALRIVAGSAGMTGAAELAASAAVRMAGFVEVATPGRGGLERPVEAVGRWLPAAEWGSSAAADLDRFGAVLAGPGLRDVDELLPLLAAPCPLVLDASALTADLGRELSRRDAATVVTPHDGEFVRLGGDDSADRIAATRQLAADLGAVVLRKGPTTVVAEPGGAVRIVANGGPELATAGTGDVLAGIVAGLLAAGAEPLDAAAAGAWVHADAGRGRRGLVASDLPGRLPAVLERLRA